MAYDTAADNPDIAVLKARQAGLRAFMEDIAEHVMSRQLPGTFLEAERSVRAVTVADRFLQTVPASASREDGGRGATPDASPVRDPYRLRLRVYADKVMEAVTFITKPDTFLEGERAGRYAWNANRMLVQLYTPPKAGKPAVGDPDMDAPDMDDDAGGRDALVNRLTSMVHTCAGQWGFWPDGTPFREGCAAPRTHMFAPDQTWPAPGDNLFDQMRNVIIASFNACARHHAESRGTWPDGTPFSPEDPPYTRVSANAVGREAPPDIENPAPDEIRVAGPWWIVRNLTAPPPRPPTSHYTFNPMPRPGDKPPPQAAPA